MSVLIGSLLLFAVWTLLVLCAGVGIYRWAHVLTGRATVREWKADEGQGSDWYRRATRAHANCVENLPVFGAVVVSAVLTGTSHALLDIAAIAVVVARMAQSTVHFCFVQTEAVAILRFGLFFVQLLAMLFMAALVAVNLV